MTPDDIRAEINRMILAAGEYEAEQADDLGDDLDDYDTGHVDGALSALHSLLAYVEGRQHPDEPWRKPMQDWWRRR